MFDTFVSYKKENIVLARGDVLDDCEEIIVTSSFLRPFWSVSATKSFESAHRGRIDVRVFIEVNVRKYLRVSRIFVKRKCHCDCLVYGCIVLGPLRWIFFIRICYVSVKWDFLTSQPPTKKCFSCTLKKCNCTFLAEKCNWLSYTFLWTTNTLF
jgi:hypothetical protein